MPPEFHPTVVLDPRPVDACGIKSFLRDTEFDPCYLAHKFDELNSIPDGKSVRLLISELDVYDSSTIPIELPASLQQAKLVYFSSQVDPVLMGRVFQGNCAGFLDKAISRPELLAALRQVIEKGNCWTRKQSRQLVGALSVQRVTLGNRASLTRKEFEILRWIAAGKTNREISEQVGSSYETVKEHVQNLLKRLDLSDRTQAAIWMTRQENRGHYSPKT